MASHDWCAYQFDRPDLGEGFAVFLRRHNSPFPTMEARLQRIEPGADYEVGLSETFVAAAPKRMRGSELANLTITLGQSPASVLLRYRRLG